MGGELTKGGGDGGKGEAERTWKEGGRDWRKSSVSKSGVKSLEAGKRKLEAGLEAKGRGEKKERGKEEMEEVGQRVASPFLGGLQGGGGQPVFSQGSLRACVP